jgi:predicted aspartyl protease
MIALATIMATSAGFMALPLVGGRRVIPTDSYISVPLHSSRTKGHIWVECEVSGCRVKLVVDTGAGPTHIVPGVAARLGLRLGPPAEGVLANGSKAESRAAEVR